VVEETLERPVLPVSRSYHVIGIDDFPQIRGLKNGQSRNDSHRRTTSSRASKAEFILQYE
jgi:hypothetical protein